MATVYVHCRGRSLYGACCRCSEVHARSQVHGHRTGSTDFFFFIPFIMLALLSRSLPVVTQIRGHIAGPPPPSPLPYYTCLHIYREKNSAFSSLVDSRRIVRSGPFFYFSISFIILALLSRSLPVVAQIRGHITGPPPPSPPRCLPSFLSREQSIFFHPSSTRVELFLPTLLSALSSFFFFC